MTTTIFLLFCSVSAALAGHPSKIFKRGVLHGDTFASAGGLEFSGNSVAASAEASAISSSGPAYLEATGHALSAPLATAGASAYASASAGAIDAGGHAHPAGAHVHLGHAIQRHITVLHKIGIPVPQPVQVPVERRVPVEVPQPVDVPVDRPYPVHVPRPYPVKVYKDVQVPVERPVPVPVKVPVEVRVPAPYKVAVPRPVPVQVERAVPYPVPQPVVVKRPVPYAIHAHLEPVHVDAHVDVEAHVGHHHHGVELEHHSPW